MADHEESRPTTSISSPETPHRKLVLDMRSPLDDSAYETDGFVSVPPPDVDDDDDDEVSPRQFENEAATADDDENDHEDDPKDDEEKDKNHDESLIQHTASQTTTENGHEEAHKTEEHVTDDAVHDTDTYNHSHNVENGDKDHNNYDEIEEKDSDIITFKLGKVDESKRFVLFFLTPSKQVVSLRNIQNGTKVSELKSKLENLTGLPAETYEFVSAKYTYRDSTALVLGKNVAMGAVIRMNLMARWKAIYVAVDRHDLDLICKEGGVTLFGAGIRAVSADDIHDQFQKRLFFALFLSAFKNERKLCDTLIELGADVNRRTDYDNTVLHVAAAQNHMPLIDFFLKKGTELLIHNKEQKTPIHIAQDIGSSSCERYMRLYNFTLTGKRLFPDVEKVSQSMERTDYDKYNQYYGSQYKYEYSERAISAASRCKSAPSRKSAHGQRDYPRTNSKFHSDCSRTVDFVTFNNVPDDMQYNTSVDYIQEPGGNITIEPPQITETIPRKIVPYIDLAKSEENRTIIDMRKPRAKSAVVRAKHTPVYYNWYKDRDINIFQPRSSKLRCKSSKSTSDLDELRRQKNEAAFKAWVRRKEYEGAFDYHNMEEEDEGHKMRYYSEEENDRAFKEWLDSKKELLEQMGRRGPGQRQAFLTKRERVQGVVQIGENEPQQTKPDPNQYHTAYQRWMRESYDEDIMEDGKYMAVEDFKRLIEDKRKRTVLNAKAYEEWLVEKRQESLLKRRMKSSRNEVTPRPETFQKWIGMTATGDSSLPSYASPKRPVSSRSGPNLESTSRVSIRSMDSLTIPVNSKSSVKSRLAPPSLAPRGETENRTKNLFDDFLYASEWRKMIAQHNAEAEESEPSELRAVRFKPLPR